MNSKRSREDMKRDKRGIDDTSNNKQGQVLNYDKQIKIYSKIKYNIYSNLRIIF